MHLKAHKVSNKGVFAFILLLQFQVPIEAKVFYFMYDVWIHQVRILVFDNYQGCLVPYKEKTLYSLLVFARRKQLFFNS